MQSLSKGKKVILLLSGAASLSALLFYIWGIHGLNAGYPLDDAWIHQTYARNLALYGTWSFIPGQISGGSTSPLWTILLSFGHLFSEKFAYTWTLLLSLISFAGMIFVLLLSLTRLRPVKTIEIVLFGILLSLEWHFLWAAVSGMETILYCLGISLIFYLSLKNSPKWVLIGLVSGMLLWVRPDGITLLGPIGMVFLSRIKREKHKFSAGLKIILPFLVIVLGYLLFNKITTGNGFPNTFYAKQAEYRELWQISLGKRIFDEFAVIFIGAGVLLLPGFIYEIYHSVRNKNWPVLGYILWVVGYGILFALRLPVSYQHSRYMIPILPVYLILGFIGSTDILALFNSQKIKNILRFALFTALILLAIGFSINGVNEYHEDVSVINDLMVTPAKWIQANTSKTDIIAVHDIGAMGYFSQRQLIDLAGLVNPEVIPFIRDEGKLLGYLHMQNAGYFVGLKDWYQTSDSWGKVVRDFTHLQNGQPYETVVIKLQ